jgi:hypothetical protein
VKQFTPLRLFKCVPNRIFFFLWKKDYLLDIRPIFHFSPETILWSLLVIYQLPLDPITFTSPLRFIRPAFLAQSHCSLDQLSLEQSRSSRKISTSQSTRKRAARAITRCGTRKQTLYALWRSPTTFRVVKSVNQEITGKNTFFFSMIDSKSNE